MKKVGLLLIVLIVLSTRVFAQFPEGISYQAIARDTAGRVIADKHLDVRFRIYDNSTTGPVEYEEEYVGTVITNKYGLFTATIGGGTKIGTSKDFSAIVWGSGVKFLEVSIDDHNPWSTGYHIIGTTQMMSVPYALYAKNAGGYGGVLNATRGQTLFYTGSKWRNTSFLYNDTIHVGIGTSSPTERLHVFGNFRLDSAFMPGDAPGHDGDFLISKGPGTSPAWTKLGGNTVAPGMVLTYTAANSMMWQYPYYELPQANGKLPIVHGGTNIDTIGLDNSIVIGNKTANQYSFFNPPSEPAYKKVLIISKSALGQSSLSWEDPMSFSPWNRSLVNKFTYLQNTNDSVGIGAAIPNSKLHVLCNGIASTLIESKTNDARLDIKAGTNSNKASLNFLAGSSAANIVFDATNNNLIMQPDLSSFSSKVIIGNNAQHNTNLEINGAIIYTPTINPDIVTGGVLTISNESYVKIDPGTGTTTINKIVTNFNPNPIVGQILIIENISSSSGVIRVTESDNVNLSGTANYNFLAQGTLTLIWNGNKWIETARSIN